MSNVDQVEGEVQSLPVYVYKVCGPVKVHDMCVMGNVKRLCAHSLYIILP